MLVAGRIGTAGAGRGSILVAAVIVATGAGCDTDPGQTAQASVTRADSGGVEIVTSSAPAWTTRPAARVSATPILSIGRLDGPAELQLFSVTDAARLSDGSVVVANAGSSDLRVYDDKGQHRFTIGREGEGPGEFRTIAALDVTAGDSLVVWDRRLRRISRFTPDGVFVESFRLQPPHERRAPRYEGRFGTGGLLVSTPDLSSTAPEDFDIESNQFLYWRYTAGGQPGDSLGRFMMGRFMVRIQTSGDQVVGFSTFRVPYDPAARLAAGKEGLFEGTGDSFEIRVHDLDGGITRVIRRAHDPVPVTSELVGRLFQEQWGDFPDDEFRESVREAYDAMPLPEYAAAFDRLMIESSGRLWARHPAMPGRAMQSWSIFDRTGIWLGDLETPVALRPFEVGDGYILGLELDELDVERVVLYSVEFP